MIIHPTETKIIHHRDGDQIQISAPIEFRLERKAFPRSLWFRFPLKYSEFISDDLDPFAVALILLAMQLNEPIEIRGTISSVLLKGLNQYQQIFHTWFPERFKIISITSAGFHEVKSDEVSSKACAFSGGVDSFYTLLQSSTLTHGLFMAGFDMPLNLTKSIAELTTSYSKLLEEMNLQLIVGSTNIRNFVNTIEWTNAHGQALAASALFFKKIWSHFYIPSSYTKKTSPRWGTHPSLDPLLSTENLKFIHHGAEKNRLQKLSLLASDSRTYNQLRVCWIQDIGLHNCGQCEKCIRTMAALHLIKKLNCYTTFHQEDRRSIRKKIQNLNYRTSSSRLFARELLIESLKKGHLLMSLDLSYSLIKRILFRTFRKLPS